MSKGSRQRKSSVPIKEFENNWEAIFGKKVSNNETKAKEKQNEPSGSEQSSIKK